jgi:hypothetical protein
MKIPNIENGKVARDKIFDYLLDALHVSGQSKAGFFLAVGYTLEGWELLAEDLKKHGRENEGKEIEKNAWGVKYSVEAGIKAPNGRQYYIRTIWMIDSETTEPRLITAYPV